MIHSQSHYNDQTFREVQLEHGRVVSSEFHDCTFLGCSFVESVFRGCRFVNCVFQACDFSLAQLPDCSFSATRFEASRLMGIDWTQAALAATRLRDSIAFYDCALNHSTFIGLELKGIQIKNCVAMDVDFREADLTQANFAGTDLTDSLFANTNLTKADLSQAHNYHIDLGQNILKQARFSLPEAMSLLYNLDIILTEGEG